jgi:hypothetical protein
MKTMKILFIHKLVAIILVFTLIIIPDAKADYYELDISEKSICFADYAKWGKVSVFIISTHFCPPCKALKNRLLQQYKADSTVDIYYCYLSKDYSDKHYQKRESFFIWQQVDVATTVYPTIYLFSSSRNLFSFYQGYSEEKFTELSQSINYLLEKTVEYFDLSLINVAQPLANAQLVQDLRREIDDLRKALKRVEENEIADKNGALALEDRKPLSNPNELERLKISTIELPDTSMLQLTHRKTTNHFMVKTSTPRKWIIW